MPEAVEPIVELSSVNFRWPGQRSFALNIRQLTLGREEKVLLVGPSGSGKSTLLSLLCGIMVPESGQIRILGKDLNKLTRSQRDRFRADHFGIIFQMFNLLPYGSVLDNVLLPLSFSSARRDRTQGQAPLQDAALSLLDRLGLGGEDLAGAPASNLSVGQQQRVAVARALIGSPEILVADEPTSALDRENQVQFLDLVFSQIEESRATLIMVSHDESLGSRFDRTVRLPDVIERTS